MSPSVSYDECSIAVPASYGECEVGGESWHVLFPGAIFPISAGVSYDECSVTPVVYEECEVP